MILAASCCCISTTKLTRKWTCSVVTELWAASERCTRAARQVPKYNLCLHWVTRQDSVNQLSHISVTLRLCYMLLTMSRYNTYWDAPDDSETDAADAEDLVGQPESTDEHKRVDVYVPDLLQKPKKLNQLKTELRRKFNVSTIEERTDSISVSGYGFDRDDVLRAVQQYYSRAS